MKVITRHTHSVEIDGQELDLTHLPEPDSIEVKRVNGKTIVGYLVRDEDCENPLTSQDGIGSIRPLGRKHSNFIDRDEALAILESDKDAVALSYFEHGLCRWDVQGSMRGMPDFNWDGVGFAGVWIPDSCVRESYTGQDGQTREQWMLEQAASACEQYTAWCNGECYGVCVDTFDKDGERINEDACWGCVGYEWAKQSRDEAMNN
jgi:hypothetical protein